MELRDDGQQPGRSALLPANWDDYRDPSDDIVFADALRPRPAFRGPSPPQRHQQRPAQASPPPPPPPRYDDGNYVALTWAAPGATQIDFTRVMYTLEL